MKDPRGGVSDSDTIKKKQCFFCNWYKGKTILLTFSYIIKFFEQNNLFTIQTDYPRCTYKSVGIIFSH